jgi:glucose-6-phosphate 1-dehydrogenase
MPAPTTIVLFGATGDLSERKLLPGLRHLFQSGLLTEIPFVGTSLDEHDRDSFIDLTRRAVEEHGGEGPAPEGWTEFAQRLHWALGQAGRRHWPRRSPRPRRSSATTTCAGCTT